MLKRLVLKFFEKTKPLVWRVAELYDIRVDRSVWATGQHPVVLKGGLEEARRLIPKSVCFNTRSGSITVGINTVFGEDVMLLTGKHLSIAEAEEQGKPLHYVPEGGRDIVIGSGCYIGSGAIIIGPVTVGDYAVIGAGAVVTKDIPARAFVAGVPARIIRSI